MVIIQIKNNLIIEEEKERISNNCSVGTYFFKDAEEFYKLANQYLKEIQNNSPKEFFIAPFTIMHQKSKNLSY